MVEYPNITVLYLDDEKDNLFVFEANFNRLFQVITSSSPIEALETLKKHHSEVTAVISDMRMPKMNGVEFIKRAREKHNDICYYILTGFGYNDEIQQAISDKVVERYFTKPFDVEEIKEVIIQTVSTSNK